MDPVPLPLAEVDLDQLRQDDRIEPVLLDDRRRGLGRAAQRRREHGADPLPGEPLGRRRRLAAAALVQRGVAATPDQAVRGRRVAGAVANQQDLLGALGRGQRPLEVDFHATIIVTDPTARQRGELETWR